MCLLVWSLKIELIYLELDKFEEASYEVLNLKPTVSIPLGINTIDECIKVHFLAMTSIDHHIELDHHDIALNFFDLVNTALSMVYQVLHHLLQPIGDPLKTC